MSAEKTPRRRTRRAPARERPLEADFGPGVAAEPPPSEARHATGPIPGIACAGEGCLLKPFADLVTRFGHRLSRGHGVSLTRAAFSGLELLRALRDFLDEEIAFAERAAGKGPGRSTSYAKIPVE